MAIYKYLMKNKGVKKVAFIAGNESDPLSQRESGSAAAKALGLQAVPDTMIYQTNTTGFTPALLIQTTPDLPVLSGVSPTNAPQFIHLARERGHTGLISAKTDQDSAVLQAGAGKLANGFISVGGASTPELASDAKKEFVKRHTDTFESNTVVYPGAMIALMLVLPSGVLSLLDRKWAQFMSPIVEIRGITKR